MVEEQQSQIAADFYGVDFKVMTATGDAPALTEAIRDQSTVGVVIAANALPDLKPDAMLPLLRRANSNSIPLLIVGLALQTDPAIVRSWSNGAVMGCKLMDGAVPAHFLFGNVNDLTRQLSGIEFSEPVVPGLYEVEGGNRAAETIISVAKDNRNAPAFSAITIGQARIFLACANSVEGNAPDVVNRFLGFAPEMVFTRYAAGDFGWHATAHYANFTIDDPWLRQSYGLVDYSGLLQEMERHNFHTTIAFIPWNFDRSQPAVVSIFRNHPNRFSIAIHGDNHDHKEFTDYKSKPYEVQLFDLKQSRARMEKFQQMTGIPYDDVMVFPHSIAPEQTLHALKVYNYLGTVNSTNVPQGEAAPGSPSFALRPETLAFENFPSISRLEVGGAVPTDFIAVNEFLDNPLFFYTHAEFFAQGIGAFDSVADKVNQLDPSVRWAGLGNILEHMYEVRRRADKDYDVLAFSSNPCIDNTTDQGDVFHVTKQESDGELIGSVSSNGQSVPYQVQGGLLSFSLAIPEGASRCVSILYRNDLNLSAIDIGKHSPVVYFLRKASDFRDIYLARLSVGLTIINYYNTHQLKPAQVLVPMFLIMLAIAYVLFRLILGWRRRLFFAGRSS